MPELVNLFDLEGPIFIVQSLLLLCILELFKDLTDVLPPPCGLKLNN